jgi:hypothetical protein
LPTLNAVGSTEIEQLGLRLVKLTGRPELAVALGVNEPSVIAWLAIGPNVIVWLALKI